MLLAEPWLSLARVGTQAPTERENTEMARGDSYKLLLNHLPACWLVIVS
jgi:hypothetical protein